MASNGLLNGLKLYGSWASPYTHRVQLALKLKGLQFVYIEEDLTNKSSSLLLHNPIYKKVPVLLHGDQSIVESVIILQYIDETWTDNSLLPSDPYERALVRFWCYFIDDKLSTALGTVFKSAGEEQKAAVSEVHENLKLVEGELQEGVFKGRRFFGGERIGLLDIVLGCGSYWLSVFEKVADVRLIDSEMFPLFCSWLKDFEEQPEVKEIIPAIDKLLEYADGVRQLMLSLSSAAGNTTTTTTTGTGNDQGSKD
ncbi:putative glutathione transferase [Dioscorea sansibarensis]